MTTKRYSAKRLIQFHIFTLFLFSCVLSSAQNDQQPSDFNIDFLGRVGGGIHACLIQGRYAYLGQSDYLRIIDISNPTQPKQIGQLCLRQEIIHKMELFGPALFIATHTFGSRHGAMEVVDVSVPSRPRLLDLNLEQAAIKDVDFKIKNNILYIKKNDPYDIRDPLKPRVREDLRPMARNIEWDLFAFSISEDPPIPAYLAPFNILTAASDVKIAGAKAYVIDPIQGLVVLDVSDPRSPVVTSAIKIPGNPQRLVINEKIALVWGAAPLLYIVDTSGPVPKLLRANPVPGKIKSVGVRGTMAYLALEGSPKLQVWNLTKPSAIHLVTEDDYKPLIEDISIQGDKMAIAQRWNASMLDLKTSSSPALLGQINPPQELEEGYAWIKTGLIGNFLCIFEDGDAGNSQVRLVDVSNPARPALAGSTGFITEYIEGYQDFWVGRSFIVMNYTHHTTQFNDSGLDVYSLDETHKSFKLTGHLGDVGEFGEHGECAIVDDKIFVANGAHGLTILRWNGAKK